jgi:D-alanyl-D-alanine carboxypeptidase/D-alanyl-D-alanine-endopeptidase (penicillin-binding protein 4)
MQTMGRSTEIPRSREKTRDRWLIRHSYRSALVWGLLALAFAWPAAGKPSQTQELAARVDALLAKKPLAKASVGVLVVRASDGATVYESGADRLLIPASNQKILTALASLDRFGPTHRFPTRIWSSSAPDVEGVVDSLIVEGGGDPTMNSEDWWRLAADLRREGLRGIRGDLRVDDTYFDAPGWHPSWGRISARAYHAPVGALTANYGSFFVSIWPGAGVGSQAHVDIDPPVDYLRMRNRAKTAAPSARPRLSVNRAQGRQTEGPPDEVVQIEGVIRLGDDGDRFPRSVLDPGLYAGSLLAYQLKANGVFLDGDVVRGAIGEESLELLLDRPGRSIAESVGLCLKYSNNSIAETLVKNLGAWEGAALDPQAAKKTLKLVKPTRQGDWVSGLRAMRAQLEGLGVHLEDARMIDGSGLSILNRVSPRALVQALEAGRSSFRIGAEFVASLPIAELDGTLERRLQGGAGRVRAKTGLLSDARVTALSGYADRGDGETLIFSILVNGHTGGSRGAMDAVDGIARVLLDAPIPAADSVSLKPAHPQMHGVH